MNSCSYPPARSSSNWYNWYNSILNISNVIIEVVSDWSWIILNTRLIESLKVGKRYFEGQLVEKLSKIFLRSTCRILMTPLLLECLFSANKMKALILFLHSQKKKHLSDSPTAKASAKKLFSLDWTRAPGWDFPDQTIILAMNTVQCSDVFVKTHFPVIWQLSVILIWVRCSPSLPPHRYTTQWREQHRKEIYFNTTWEFSMRFPSICHPWVWGVRW